MDNLSWKISSWTIYPRQFFLDNLSWTISSWTISVGQFNLDNLSWTFTYCHDFSHLPQSVLSAMPRAEAHWHISVHRYIINQYIMHQYIHLYASIYHIPMHIGKYQCIPEAHRPVYQVENQEHYWENHQEDVVHLIMMMMIDDR